MNYYLTERNIYLDTMMKDQILLNWRYKWYTKFYECFTILLHNLWDNLNSSLLFKCAISKDKCLMWNSSKTCIIIKNNRHTYMMALRFLYLENYDNLVLNYIYGMIYQDWLTIKMSVSRAMLSVISHFSGCNEDRFTML